MRTPKVSLGRDATKRPSYSETSGHLDLGVHETSDLHKLGTRPSESEKAFKYVSGEGRGKQGPENRSSSGCEWASRPPDMKALVGRLLACRSLSNALNTNRGRGQPVLDQEPGLPSG